MLFGTESGNGCVILTGVWQMGNDLDREMRGGIDFIPCLDDGK